ncbi:TPA: AbrB/MazE/SpoVT family DNA-binding domain-containing protein [Candidatus Avacholeplasma faecigallinarum]|nr:AbrB/MazE/SpoVT family DNA-binding domain-containing protein [Candidatus Avacholeplasma faecigallinarum]
MKETGVVRRLDELVRVVIPKEIRSRLKIKNGDLVDIFTNNEEIILQKYHPLSRDILPIRSVLEAFKRVYNVDFILFDSSKVLYSTYNEISSGENINQEFIQKIQVYLDKELSSKLNINIIENYKLEKDIFIQNIQIDYEDFGYIAICDDMISKKDKDTIEIIKLYFQYIQN